MFHVPSFKALARHSLPGLVESSIGPGVIFYVVLVTAGFKGALVGALVWAYLAVGRRLLRRERPSGLLVLSLVLLTARSIVSFATGSAVVYFIQPSVSTFLVAVLFLVTALSRRPLIERLALDFCPLDPDLMARPFIKRFFVKISLLWAIVLLTNAGFVLWLLFSTSLHAFVLERTIVSTALTVGGVALSISLFLRVMRGHGVTVRFGGSPVPATVPADTAA
ncbi:MAG TPA: VC0807 family protein [Acidimicrobiales bacterium]|nr:VC0807 family protein [Acidimicrobiales bacterium]